MGPVSPEARRQSALLTALRAPCPAPGPLDDAHPAVAHLLSAGIHPESQGLRAYQLNAQAHATQVLRSSYPTVLTMLGDEAVSHLAHSLWHSHPPRQGDLSLWGRALPGLLQQAPELQAWPWLADVARIDWLRHVCSRAADVTFDADSLQRLGDTDPAQLRLRARPGTACLTSRWPVAELWLAHQVPDEQERDDTVARLAAQAHATLETPQHHALVWRSGWLPQVCVLPEPSAQWMRPWLSLEAGAPASTVADGLAAADPSFDVGDWLATALREGWLWRVEVI